MIIYAEHDVILTPRDKEQLVLFVTTVWTTNRVLHLEKAVRTTPSVTM